MAANNAAMNSNLTRRLPPSMGIGLAEDKRQTIIRVLLAVDNEARLIINSARAEKIAKLKEAKKESEIEVAGLRTEMELEYQKSVAELAGGSGENQKRMEQDAETKINWMKQEAEKVRDDVALMLLHHVAAFRF